MERLHPYLWIALGAMLGANLRYLVSRGLAQWLGIGFPYGTFVVNIVGCLAIGATATLVMARLVGRPEILQPAILVGFLGSLTTFSSFGWETFTLFNDGAWMRGLANIFLSVFAGLAAVMLGVYLASRVAGAP